MTVQRFVHLLNLSKLHSRSLFSPSVVSLLLPQLPAPGKEFLLGFLECLLFLLKLGSQRVHHFARNAFLYAVCNDWYLHSRIAINCTKQTTEVILDKINKSFVKKDVRETARRCNTKFLRQNLKISHQGVASELRQAVDVLVSAHLRGKNWMDRCSRNR